jgi:hypothetical protein
VIFLRISFLSSVSLFRFTGLNESRSRSHVTHICDAPEESRDGPEELRWRCRPSLNHESRRLSVGRSSSVSDFD